jgi:(1->4)-alpha-D-glucan 1-alpha-D-glucosylmutase
VTRTASVLPHATYRLQLHAGFTLDDAAAIVPYLARLGVSHLYSSPILQAAPGSTHGYDVVDHERVSRELGGEAAFERLVAALHEHDMGLVLDIVPNHMAISEENRWWWDVLQNGRASRYAGFFDVDWDPPESRLRNVILLPVLPDHYGRVLESGEIGVVRDGARIVATHADQRFPVDPRSLGPLLTAAAERAGSEELATIARRLAALPASTSRDARAVTRRQRDADTLSSTLAELLAVPAVAAAVDSELERLARDTERLDAFLEDQNYRLALWRAAARDLGYRRFFDIDELIGLRVEDPEVFAATHRLVLDWVERGMVDGLRIDHPDGLRDPAAYIARLREAAPHAWIVVEKILAPDETLPPDWPVDGTTGYGFANRCTGLMVDARAQPVLDELWASVADVDPAWEAVEETARVEVLTSVLGSDLNRLTDLFVSVCEANRRYRDFTRHELHEALREVAARLPVYRTYVTPRGASQRDARLIDETVAAAAAGRTDLDPQLFEFLGSILRLEVDGTFATELGMRFQQLTPAAIAKGVEDTAFYRHHRLVALNEVGGDPGRFGCSVSVFHESLGAAGRDWPAAMLGVSTHDTKRSADMRARLALLSQDADAWRELVARLTVVSARHRAEPTAPTDADAYLFFQTVVGAWPIEVDRVVAYMEKATHEAKLHTSWTDPNAAYDAAVSAFVRGSLADPVFVDAVERHVGMLDDAWKRTALAQLALQLTAPGVPDIYQGNELWDLSLVDPDNRRPVDFTRRRRMLEQLEGRSAEEAWNMRDSGAPKLWLLHRLLERRDRVEPGRYTALAASGTHADAVVAFSYAGRVTIVPRLALRVERDGWGDTAVELPDGEWRNLDGCRYSRVARLVGILERFPVAVMERAS